MKSIGSSEAQSKKKAAAKRQAASALRLEAGRYSRDAKLRRTEHSVEKTIGQGLVETFGPIKKILHHDQSAGCAAGPAKNERVSNPQPIVILFLCTRDGQVSMS